MPREVLDALGITWERPLPSSIVTTTADPEQAAIRAFVVRARQALYLALQSDIANRARFLERLLSGRDFDPAMAVPLGDDEQEPDQIAARLHRMGAPDGCHVIGDIDTLDGRDATLDETLKRLVGSGKRALVSCVPGRLAFFEAGNDQRFLLQGTSGRKSAEQS
jgi:hypothetical protein